MSEVTIDQDTLVDYLFAIVEVANELEELKEELDSARGELDIIENQLEVKKSTLWSIKMDLRKLLDKEHIKILDGEDLNSEKNNGD